MFDSKCAEVFCQNYEHFYIVCTDCNLKTNVFNEFVLHYQDIHLHSSIKVESAPKIGKAEDDVYVAQNLIDSDFPINARADALDIKDEICQLDEYEIDESLFSASDEDLPLQVILKNNPLEDPEDHCGKTLHHHRKMKQKDLGEICSTVDNLRPNLGTTEDDSVQRIKKEAVSKSNVKASVTVESLVSGSDCDSAQQDNKTVRKQFPCPECNKSYSNRKSLRIHFHRHHPDAKLPRLNAAPLTTSCPDCPNKKSFKTRKSLQRHRREYHSNPPVDNYPCPHCEKQFKSRERVTAHMRLVHKITKKPIELKHYPCSQCERIFTEKYLLKRHEIRHTGIRSVICSEPGCEMAFFDAKSMGAHRRSAHSNIRKFVCHICGFATKTGPSLQTHIRGAHTKERPFKCEQCGKCFTTSAAVAEHKVIHTAHIRPHVCDVCGKSFSRPKALYHHKPLHLGIKKFVCKICGKAYAQQAGLSAHKRQHNLDAIATLS